MNKVNIDLANCYGIKKLTDCFDFGHIDSNNNESLYSIYAPNGFMKTSLAKVFNDVQKAKDTSDLIFPDRETIRTINDENGDPLKPETIFVIEPYIEGYTSENTSNLLVNPTLKAEYDHTLKKIDTELSSILKTLKQLSGLNGRTVTPTTEILSCFNKPDDGIHEFINQIAKDVSTDTEFENITYSEVFNDQTIKLLESGDIKQQIQDYIERYTDLVNKSPVLNKKFNHSGASDLTKNLSKNGFFEAQHTINVFDGNQKNEVVSAKEFEEIVNNEKEKILSDTELLKNFDAVDKKLGSS